MRLVVLGPGHPFRGGIAVATSELVRALVARGHEVRFLTPRRQYPAWLYPGRDDRDPQACAELECAHRCLDPFAPTTWPAVKRAARAFGADAWVLPYWTWAWSPWWRYVLAGRGLPPAVGVVHNPVDHDGGVMQRSASHLVLRRCQALFTHGERLRQELASRYPGVPAAAHPLPAGAVVRGPDPAVARAQLGLPEAARVALFLGLIRPYKGVDLLLDACARLRERPGWFLVVAGEAWGAMEGKLRRLVARLGISDRVRLDLRWVPEADVTLLLAAADLLVLPYRSGSQSAVAPLALAHGVPVLSTDVGSIAEVVAHGVNGLVVRPGAAAELAQALDSLDRQRLGVLAAGARASAKELTWPRYAEALERLVNRVVR